MANGRDFGMIAMNAGKRMLFCASWCVFWRQISSINEDLCNISLLMVNPLL